MQTSLLADLAFAGVGLDHEECVVIDSAFCRPSEVDMLLGNPVKATLGWSATADVETMISMISMAVDADVANVSSEKDR